MPSYDVLLCHNSNDKKAVRATANALLKKNIRVWFDEWDLRPGQQWQEEIERAIEESAAIAIFVGPDGLGPWHGMEARASINLAARFKRPVIPVLLPGAPSRLPIFLELFTWVDFRVGSAEKNVEKLVWGIHNVAPAAPTLKGATSPRSNTWDPLNSLHDKELGRKYLQESLPSEVDERNVQTISIALVDVDGLTNINKQFGTAVGDKVLRRMGNLLRKKVDAKYQVGRCGDDTYFVCMPHLAEVKAWGTCELFRKTIRGHSWNKIAAGLQVSCSVGFATKHPGEPCLDVIIRATLGMKEAKFLGRNVLNRGPLHLSRTESRQLSRHFS